ncbi:hypothetical protein [Neobacillus sp.]|uniref:hypothetical protein n=1 Tax=Neobacillus sp. TaxID=2675273 RepID=UPI0035B53569
MTNAKVSVDLTDGLAYLRELTESINKLNENLEKLNSHLGGKVGIDIKFDKEKFLEQVRERISESIRQKNGAANISI